MILTAIRFASVTRLLIVFSILMFAGCSGGTRQIRLNESGEKIRHIEVIIDNSQVKDSDFGPSLVKKLEEKSAIVFQKVSVRNGYGAENPKVGELVIVPLLVSGDARKREGYNGTAWAQADVKVIIDNRVLNYYSGRGDSTVIAGNVEDMLVLVSGLTLGFPIGSINRASARNSAIEDAAVELLNQMLSSTEFRDYVESVKLSKIEAAELALRLDFSDKESFMPNNIIDAGEESALIVGLTNKGKGTAFDVNVNIEADTKEIEINRNIFVGDVRQGETKDVRIALKSGFGIKDGKTAFTITCTEKRGYDAKKVVFNIPTAKLEKPQIEIVSTELNDGETGLAKGNGNGIPENGETVELTVFVKNQGVGKAIGVNLTGNKAAAGIQWIRDSVHIGTIQPGKTEKAKLAFAIPRNFDASEIVANLRVSDMRGVNEADKKVALSYVKRSPAIQFASRITSRGTQVNALVNGEVYEVDITLSNRGEIPAKDVSVSISSGRGIGLSDKTIHLDEIKAGESVSKRVTLSIPRTFAEQQALLNFAVSQTDFPIVKETIQYAVDVKRPKPTYLASLQSSSGGNTLEQGESSVFEVQVLNEGSLPANGVKVTVKSKDDNLKLSGQTDSLLGIIPANSRSETIKIPVTAVRRIKTGDAFLDVNITQEDFPPVAAQYAINIIEEGAVVVDVESEGRGRNRPVAKAQSGPVINLKSSQNELTTEENSYRLAFDTEDVRNIERIIVAVNGIVILNQSPGLKRMELFKDIPLRDGENRIAITAYNADNVTSRKELVITRLAEDDVDTPTVTTIRKPDAVAIVIGISKYENKDIPSVNYARRDAAVVKDYLIKTLGFKETNIKEFYDEQATFTKLTSYFKTHLKNRVQPDISDVFIFYSGHGVPEGNEAYFAPYDLDPGDIKNTGYAVKELYAQLNDIKAKGVTVAIDACFSGTSDSGVPIIKSASPVFFDISNPLLKAKSSVVFTSSTGKQISSWYDKKQHGLFTYYFLQGLKGMADINKDGEITAGELERHIFKNVTEQARILRDRVQTPEVTGDKDAVVIRYK